MLPKIRNREKKGCRSGEIIRDRTRHAAQTAQRRGADLQQRSERLADETAEEREARLRQMTASNHARLAAETAEEREARLQSDRVLVRHRHQLVMQAQLPLFQQSSVRTKMLKFHAHHMATLDVLRCTCSERFPGLKIHSHSTECLQIM